MPRREKFEEYGLKTKTTTIRIPDLKDLDRERDLRKKIDVLVIDFIKKGLEQKSSESYIEQAELQDEYLNPRKSKN